MSPPLISTLVESCRCLQDHAWHQTAGLMIVAAAEVESLNRRIAQLQGHLRALDEAHETRPILQTSDETAVGSARR
jgi:hypothetical protein